MTTSLKYQVANRWIEDGYKVSLVLRIVGLPKSTYYYFKNKNSEDRRKYNAGAKPKGYSYNYEGKRVADSEIKDLLRKYQEGRECYYGYRKLKHALLKEHKILVNHKKVYRLCKELKILKKCRVKGKISKILATTKEVVTSNHLWEIDIKHGYIQGLERSFYICEIIDVFDRNIIDYHIGYSCKANEVDFLLQRAVKSREEVVPKNLWIRSDNGSQFTSKTFKNTCEKLGVNHERIPNATPNKNAHIESFHSILEREVLTYNYFENFQEVYEEIYDFINFYNNKRLHSSLNFNTPKEFYEMNKGKISPEFRVAA